jgi:hypothetical protein
MRLQSSIYRLLPIFLLLLNSLPRGAEAAELAVRGNCCSGGDIDEDHQCTPDPSDAGDEATDDQSPGIGFEFEASGIRLRTKADPKTCSPNQLTQAKGRILAGRTGTNWELTADTSTDSGATHPEVDAEYILNGQTIKLNSGDLKTAADAAGNDVVSSTFE